MLNIITYVTCDKLTAGVQFTSNRKNMKAGCDSLFPVFWILYRNDWDVSSVNCFHSVEVQEGWLTSLLATRGLQSPPPPELHGQVTIKDTRSRAYAAVWGHDLWIYPNKDSFLLGIASFAIPLSVATVKSKGKQSFTLITPYKTFKYAPISPVSMCNRMMFPSVILPLWLRLLPTVYLLILPRICPSGWTACPPRSKVLCPAARWLCVSGRTRTTKCVVTVEPPALSGLQSTCYLSSVTTVQVNDKCMLSSYCS